MEIGTMVPERVTKANHEVELFLKGLRLFSWHIKQLSSVDTGRYGDGDSPYGHVAYRFFPPSSSPPPVMSHPALLLHCHVPILLTFDFFFRGEGL